MRIDHDRDGWFNLDPLKGVEVWSLTFLKTNGEKILFVIDKDDMASTMFDLSLKGMSIAYMDYDGRSSHLAVVMVEDETKGTNITAQLIEDMMGLDWGNWIDYNSIGKDLTNEQCT